MSLAKYLAKAGSMKDEAKLALMGGLGKTKNAAEEHPLAALLGGGALAGGAIGAARSAMPENDDEENRKMALAKYMEMNQ